MTVAGRTNAHVNKSEQPEKIFSDCILNNLLDVYLMAIIVKTSRSNCESSDVFTEKYMKRFEKKK